VRDTGDQLRTAGPGLPQRLEWDEPLGIWAMTPMKPGLGKIGPVDPFGERESVGCCPAGDWERVGPKSSNVLQSPGLEKVSSGTPVDRSPTFQTPWA
jgi:hypothetical protein